MKFFRYTIAVLFALLATSCAALGQAPSNKLAFEVATVKPAAPLDMQRLAADAQAGRMPKLGQQLDAARATYSYMSLDALIAMAYHMRVYQISGPAWLKDTRFDIEAKYPDGATKDDVPTMLQALLQERFKLDAHRSSQEQKVLALVTGKSGPKMKEATTVPAPIDPNSPLKPGERQIDGLDGPVRMQMHSDGSSTINMGAKGTITQKFNAQDRTFHIQSDAVSMTGLAGMLSNFFSQMGGANSRQVVDMTGVKGYYQIDLELSFSDLMSLVQAQGFGPPPSPGGDRNANSVPVASDPGGGTSLFQSVEKLGLKMENRKAIVEQLVVDHIEKTPTEN